MVGKCIGKRIAELRKKRNMTQEELSETIGISPHYLSALERGIYNIKLEKLVMIINFKYFIEFFWPSAGFICYYINTIFISWFKI